MVEAGVRTQVDTTLEPRSPKQADETALFVAALAAALAEHRRRSGDANTPDQPEDSRTNWKTVARLERLRGRA